LFFPSLPCFSLGWFDIWSILDFLLYLHSYSFKLSCAKCSIPSREW
jgi:hypothetical protein